MNHHLKQHSAPQSQPLWRLNNMLASDPNNMPRVSLNPVHHYGQSWRCDTAPGKPLTNGVITHRMKEGFYGEVAKQAALAKTKVTGFIDRCACGSLKGVKFAGYKYLPKPNFYCPTCLAKHREGHAVKAKTNGMARRDLNEFI